MHQCFISHGIESFPRYSRIRGNHHWKLPDRATWVQDNHFATEHRVRMQLQWLTRHFDMPGALESNLWFRDFGRVSKQTSIQNAQPPSPFDLRICCLFVLVPLVLWLALFLPSPRSLLTGLVRSMATPVLSSHAGGQKRPASPVTGEARKKAKKPANKWFLEGFLSSDLPVTE